MTGSTGVELTYRDRSGRIVSEVVRPADVAARTRELRAIGTRTVQSRKPNALTPAVEPAPKKSRAKADTPDDTPKG